MNEELISLITVNRDAVGTNRGFYYQYLTVVLRWIDNFIKDNAADIFTEVDDDIKEVGDQLIFSQLKCYSSSLSLKSPEIHKALLNFFSHYLTHSSNDVDLNFQFITNTFPTKNQHLLRRWLVEQPLSSGEFLTSCIREISKILCKEIEYIRNKKLSKISAGLKSQMFDKFEVLLNFVKNQEELSDFVSKIKWEFQKLSPEESVDELVRRINMGLSDPKFGDRPVKLLFEAMLSEIYRRSQLADPQKRKVNNIELKILIELNDDELNAHVDKRLAHLIDFRVLSLESKVNKLEDKVFETSTAQQQNNELLKRMIEQSDRSPKPLSKYLTRIPYVNSSQVVGRREHIAKLHDLFVNFRHVSVDGSGGMGKSTILKLYLNQYQKEYDHLVWLNIEPGLVNTFSLNTDLIKSLNIPSNPEQHAENFSQILSALHAVPGTNLMIIDGYSNSSTELQELQGLPNWKILVGTRLRLPNLQSITIGRLSFEEAKILYISIDTQNPVTNEELINFFEAIDYNTLTIRLVAKTIYNSLDLSLFKVMQYFESQELENTELQIDILDENGLPSRLLNFLKMTFDLSLISHFERYYLLFFALLPSQDVSIGDLVEWYGTGNVSENKTTLINVINKLHDKGLIERSGGQIGMHKMLRQMVFYSEKQEARPFFSQSIHITLLKIRIQEGASHNFDQALQFLKYGDAFITNIKEENRKLVYLPMLQLENEVLNIYNSLNTKADLVGRWKSLHGRAQKFLQSKHGLLGVISNNFSLALVNKGDQESAISYFDQALEILEVQAEAVIPHLLITLCNLCRLLISRGEMKQYFQVLGRIKEIREKHKIWDDVSMPVQASVMGSAYQKIEDYDKAIEMFNLAMELHTELPKEKRNDFQFVSYKINITECYLWNKQLEKAKQSAFFAIGELSKIDGRHTVYLRELTMLLIKICKLNGETEQAREFERKLENMEYRPN